jgi:hypothetical protein
VMNLVMDSPTPAAPASEPQVAPEPESYTPPAKVRPAKDKRANAK